MDTQAVVERIKTEISPVMEEASARLVEISLKGYGGNLRLSILVDKKEGRINIGECASINKKIGDIIEEKSLINQKYILEVSSPGIDYRKERHQ